MSDDWQVVEEAIDAPVGTETRRRYQQALTRLREREAQLEHLISEEQKCTRFFNDKREAAEARVARLEEALREIASLPDQTEQYTEADTAVAIARSALAHEEEA